MHPPRPPALCIPGPPLPDRHRRDDPVVVLLVPANVVQRMLCPDRRSLSLEDVLLAGVDDRVAFPADHRVDPRLILHVLHEPLERLPDRLTDVADDFLTGDRVLHPEPVQATVPHIDPRRHGRGHRDLPGMLNVLDQHIARLGPARRADHAALLKNFHDPGSLGEAEAQFALQHRR